MGDNFQMAPGARCSGSFRPSIACLKLQQAESVLRIKKWGLVCSVI